MAPVTLRYHGGFTLEATIQRSSGLAGLPNRFRMVSTLLRLGWFLTLFEP